jgi:hypothetical protein
MDRLRAALLWLSGAVALVLSSGFVDDGLLYGLKLLLGTEAGREQAARLAGLLWLSVQRFWLPLQWALGAALLLAVATTLPLVLRALRRRPVVFISYHHGREAQAAAVESALARHGLKPRRLPFEPGAEHQRVVVQMQELQRGADAVVCLPGDAPSAADAEVYAAAVALQPVVFVIDGRDASLPNVADKRYPVMKQSVLEQFAWAPLAEWLHHVCGDARSTWPLYRQALASPALGMATAPLTALLLLVLTALVVMAVLHGVAATAGWPVNIGLHRGQLVAVQAVVLTLGALALLAPAAYLALVARHVAVQLVAARRASLRAGEAAFRREDWIGLIPGLEPGQPLYLSLVEQAPLAHHERPAKTARARRKASSPGA